MNESKYVIMDSPLLGEFPIIFPSMVKHSFIVECIYQKYPGIKCVSAGFINGDGGCYGKSESLKIGSRNNDTNIIINAFPFLTQRGEC